MYVGAEIRIATKVSRRANYFLITFIDNEYLLNSAFQYKNVSGSQKEIAKKVQDVLAKTPLQIKPRRELPRFGKYKNIKASLIDIETSPQESHDNFATQVVIPPETPPSQPPFVQPEVTQPEITNVLGLEAQPLLLQPEVTETEKTNILGLETDRVSTPNSPLPINKKFNLSENNTLELLTPSPLGFASFDTRSIDDLMTPDEFGTDQIPPGLSNVNYDLDLSDFSAENSVADDVPKAEPKDPFSPEGIQSFDPFSPRHTAPRDPFSPILESFDEFTLLDSKTNQQSDPFEVIHRPKDPFSPIEPQSSKDEQRTQNIASDLTNRSLGVDFAANRGIGNIAASTNQAFDPFSPVTSVQDVAGPSNRQSQSILDDHDSPTTACLLPSPLQPQSSDKC